MVTYQPLTITSAVAVSDVPYAVTLDAAIKAVLDAQGWDKLSVRLPDMTALPHARENATAEDIWGYTGAQGRTLTRAVNADDIATAGTSVTYAVSNAHDQEAHTLLVDQHSIQNVIMTFYLDGESRTVTGNDFSVGGYTQAGHELFLKTGSDIDKTIAANQIGVTLDATDLAEDGDFHTIQTKMSDGADVNERYKDALKIVKSNIV